jgi:molecular chaperone DnaK (HSP70)
MSRYIVGIDLGTTNCAVAFVDTEAPGDKAIIEHLAIDQVTAPGEVEDRPALPSFLLLPTEHELKREAMSLPWAEAPDYVVGTLARERGAELPHRVVASAKSWLSNDAVDRTAAILPWHGSEDDDDGGEKVSPVDASARYLEHLRHAWAEFVGDEDPLEDQDIFLTVPASFDAVARELTVTAAKQAGLPRVTLIEEPQAAFYSWLAQSGDDWRESLEAGDVVLVCDVGGGTTDFSLIAVTDDGKGNLELERVAVGDHILLGGDNMDLTLAHSVAQRLKKDGKKLKGMQFRALVHACRRVKESLLSEGAADEHPITLLGSGSKIIGGAIRTSIMRSEAEALLVDGFFPKVGAEDKPKQHRALGLRELGLPYATDPAISKHLAEFLSRHGRPPTAILWNGGVMKGSHLRERLGEVIESWFDSKEMPSLRGTNLDLAVANGAAYFGLVRRGRGIRIRGGTARSYYIGVESAMPAIPGFEPPVKALCVAPFGMEEGSSATLPDEELGLTVGENTVFRFFASSTRKDDVPGTVVDLEEDELLELAPVETNLDVTEKTSSGDVVPVSLSAQVTEIGTLELWCSARDASGKWKLEYSVRDHQEHA